MVLTLIISMAFGVASFAEAWIEIRYGYNDGIYRKVASFAEAWIEIGFLRQLHQCTSRLLRGGVD